MDHNLENLGPERFQQLCQALLTQEFPGVTCFPVAQPDGGRDALRQVGDDQPGKLLVYQVKYSRKPLSGDEARKWVLEAIEGEVEKVRALIERGASQYLLITNVAGTAHLDTGSIDRMQGELTSRLGIPAQCWWRDDLNRRLDGSWDLKLRYPEVLSGQDFLRLLMDSSKGTEQERRRRAITAFMAHQYQEDAEVKFKQVELQNRLLDLFVDLPFTLVAKMDEGAAHDFAAAAPFHVRVYSNYEPGTCTLDDAATDGGGGTATLLLGDFAADKLGQVVVEGAPGQGKSTLAQYICQVHRIRWLAKNAELAQLPPGHVQTALRLPIKVDLRELADWISGIDPFEPGHQKPQHSEARSLEAFLARLVQHRSGGIAFDVNDLLDVSRIAPLLIVLDGLDEVADLKGRADVVAAVSKALPRMRENCPALRLVVTSRPAAFANSPGFDPQNFPHIELGAVRRAQIQLYAKKWMDARSLHARERAEFEAILNEKMEQPHLRDLARNPMQLTILLSLIHTRGAALPDKRTGLYDAYVDLFFSREASKSVAVRQHIELLKDIHKYLAWMLHAEAETNRKRASGRVPAGELRRLLQSYLERERHSTAVVDEVFGAMLERVVMIVPRVEGTYEFEVQPLREYFAARYLYDTASYSPPGRERGGTKPDRFNAMARNFYWLNVTRFFCGCFTKGELLDLAEHVKDLGADPVLGRTRYPAMLGAMLLSDWVFAQTPRAVAVIAAMLSTREALRRLAPADVHYRADRAMQIPSQCGGSEIVEQAFVFLEEKQTRGDLAWRLADLINANAPSEAVRRRWLSAASRSLQGDTERWLWLGLQLGALCDAEKRDVMSVLGEGPLSVNALSLLLDAGRYDCAFSSEANAEVSISRLLDGPVRLRTRRTLEGPLYLLPTILSSTSQYTFGRHALFHGPVVKIARDFQAAIEAQTVGTLLLPSALDATALSISKKFAALVNGRGGAAGITAGMEEVVEDSRAAWGERPAVVALACAVAHLPRRPGARSRAVCLFDRDRPVCDRLRFARSRAKDSAWWAGQIAAARDSGDRFMVHLAFWAWAPVSTAFGISEALAEALERLPACEWQTLLNFASLFINRGPLAPGREDAVSALPVHLPSNRLALLVGLKDQATYGRAVFLEHLLNGADGGRTAAEFRQGRAFEAAMAGALDWRAALSVIRSTYSEGASSSVALMSAAPLRRTALPDSVAQQVLAVPREYPVRLWDAAEAVASAQLRKQIRPVGTIAKNEHWFDG